MGNVAGRLFRPLRNWNIENRAHKVISRDKPRPAPTFKSTQKQIDLVNQLEPNYKEESKKKDVTLDENLRNVFVRSNSSEVQEIDSRTDPDRPLPRNKVLSEPFEFGFYEPKIVKAGRISLRQTLELISKHNKEPTQYTSEVLALEYKLEKKLVDDILEHYRIYEVVKFDKDFNTDQIARPLRISLKTGITIPHTESKKDKKQAKVLEEEPKKIASESSGSLEEKKRLKLGDK
ncbi:hypothetical protein QAD02_010834 [Eretmocerus hayati]|uniref:Uncharacterized protein n=1 Tax=Eretmocerus hayati TaxID=131215 RepID=A0ACC2NW17_9HYME|nr:hypothetical protein QAD02_010834 [Eretmocerus hayati]